MASRYCRTRFDIEFRMSCSNQNRDKKCDRYGLLRLPRGRPLGEYNHLTNLYALTLTKFRACYSSSPLHISSTAPSKPHPSRTSYGTPVLQILVLRTSVYAPINKYHCGTSSGAASQRFSHAPGYPSTQIFHWREKNGGKRYCDG